MRFGISVHCETSRSSLTYTYAKRTMQIPAIWAELTYLIKKTVNEPQSELSNKMLYIFTAEGLIKLKLFVGGASDFLR